MSRCEHEEADSRISVNLEHHHHHQLCSVHCRTKASHFLFHSRLSLVCLCQPNPANFLSSSTHLIRCLPLLRFPSLGIHSVSLIVHLFHLSS